MIPLICIDVDGTLVGASGTPTEAVWAAIDQALERGQHLAVSTARGAFGASWEMAKRLDPSGWHVFHAGAAIVHSGSGQARSHRLATTAIDALRELEQRSTERGWLLELYSPDAYAVESSAKAAVDHAGLIGIEYASTPFDDFLAAQDSIVRAQLVVPVDDIAAAQEQLAPLGLSTSSATSPIMPGIAFISIAQPGITKATGIAQICEELGYTIDQVMMMGDGLNDLPAIEAVGHPVAMGNAEDRVKALASHIVADVEHDGVVEALELSASLSP